MRSFPVLAVTVAVLAQGPDFIPTPGFIVAVALATIPLLGVMVWGAVKIFAPVTQALAHRIVGRTDEGGALRAEVEELRLRLDAVQGELVETQERLDFTERLLTRGPLAPSDGGGGGR